MYIHRGESKPVHWLGPSLKTVQGLGPDIRRLMARQLDRVSNGLQAGDWKPMPSVGLGVEEIRIRTGREYRVVHVAKFPEAVYVIHVFEKKSRKTPHRDIEVARGRFAILMARRRLLFRAQEKVGGRNR